jgi:hypothetical protein
MTLKIPRHERDFQGGRALRLFNLASLSKARADHTAVQSRRVSVRCCISIQCVSNLIDLRQFLPIWIAFQCKRAICLLNRGEYRECECGRY